MRALYKKETSPSESEMQSNFAEKLINFLYSLSLTHSHSLFLTPTILVICFKPTNLHRDNV